MKIFATLLLFLVLFAANAQPADKPFIAGRVDELESKELGEKRTLNIYLPEGYDTAKTRFPAIYLLDGSANEDFLHTAGLVQFLVMMGMMQPHVVIGIANVDRKRDFTFAPDSGFVLPAIIPKGKRDFPKGGSAKFISFIEKELQPYINRKYKVNGQKTIIGQSLGGLLATEVLAKHTHLFNNYIIVSPSLWWNNESLLKDINAKVPAGVNVFIAVGKEGKMMVGDAKALARSIKVLKPHFEYMPKEDHATILHNALYKALQWLK